MDDALLQPKKRYQEITLYRLKVQSINNSFSSNWVQGINHSSTWTLTGIRSSLHPLEETKHVIRTLTEMLVSLSD